MAFGDTKNYMETVIERELVRAGDGAVDAALAKRIAAAVAEAMFQNNGSIERELRQKMQVSGLHV